MKTVLLIFSLASFGFGATILFYDAYFIRRYGVDANDVLGTDGYNIVDWETGTRPAYANYPAWHFGIAFVLLAALFLTVFVFLPRRRNTR
jgi:hypothetical protein